MQKQSSFFVGGLWVYSHCVQMVRRPLRRSVGGAQSILDRDSLKQVKRLGGVIASKGICAARCGEQRNPRTCGMGKCLSTWRLLGSQGNKGRMTKLPHRPMGELRAGGRITGWKKRNHKKGSGFSAQGHSTIRLYLEEKRSVSSNCVYSITKIDVMQLTKCAKSTSKTVILE